MTTTDTEHQHCDLDDLGELDFTIGHRNGRRVWLVSDGTVLPYIAGGDGPDDDDAGGDGDEDGSEGDGEEGDDSSGDDDGADDEDGSDGDDGVDWKAEAEKWKKSSRKHESRAKASNKELQKIRREGMSPEHKALEDAKDEGRNEARVEFGERLVEAEIRAQSAGRITDGARDQLIENLAHDRFLTDDGDVDTDMVKDLIEGLAGPAKGANDDKHGKLDSGQGRRQGSHRKGKRTASVASGRDTYQEMHGGKSQ